MPSHVDVGPGNRRELRQRRTRGGGALFERSTPIGRRISGLHSTSICRLTQRASRHSTTKRVKDSSGSSPIVSTLSSASRACSRRSCNTRPNYEMQLLIATQVADEHRHLQSVLRIYEEVFGVKGGFEAIRQMADEKP